MVRAFIPVSPLFLSSFCLKMSEHPSGQKSRDPSNGPPAASAGSLFLGAVGASWAAQLRPHSVTTGFISPRLQPQHASETGKQKGPHEKKSVFFFFCFLSCFCSC